MPYRFPGRRRPFLVPILLGLICLALAAPLHAAGEAETAARNFLKFLRSDKTILSSEVLEGNLLEPSLAPVAVGHLFHLSGGGYLLISCSRTISPVKAYALGSDFTALPASYRKALLGELELRTRVAQEAAGRMPLDAGTTETGARWDFLLGWDGGRMPLDYTEGSALLRTRWNQTHPYNKFLPQVNGQTVVTGCVNVAAAQVMRYHRHPAASKGVVSYLWDGPPEQTLKTILYRSHNWDNMPEALDSTTPEYQADEVALLIRDVGIANLTDFAADGSSTSLNSRMLLENFGYSTSLSDMDNADFAPFLATLKGEIDAERPVMLSLPGHMTVADGYRTDSTGQSVHINLGWGGVADDFYFLDDSLDPWVHAGGYNFPTTAGALRIYFNIKPCGAAAGDCAVNWEAGDGAQGLAIAGNFNQDGDKDLYEVYLKGATTIRGTRGYDQLGFYFSIASLSDGSDVFPAPDPGAAGNGNRVFDAGSFASGKYAVRVSLCNVEENYCYAPQTGYDHYTVTLTSGALTAGEKAAADQALERPPVIGNTLPDLLLKTNGGTRKILIDARDENGDAVTLSVQNSNPAAVAALLNGNILELTPTGAAKVSSRIAVTAEANGQTVEKVFTAMTDDAETGFGRSYSLGGTFSGQNDVELRRAVLDGDCTITGDKPGSSNQAFFSSVLGAGGGVLASADGSSAENSVISHAFPGGLYDIRASLCMNTGSGTSCYSYSVWAGVGYSFMVSCPDADESASTIAGLLGIDLSGANLPFDKPGDIDGNGSVTLADAILVLRMLSGMGVSGETNLTAGDANGDRKIALPEALFILQRAAGLRPQ